jgi:hypothetical protein
VVGTAFNVDRTYFGGQLESGEGVTLDYHTISLIQDQSRIGLHLGGV